MIFIDVTSYNIRIKIKMGQVKGNPTPSYQNQAYETLRPNLGTRDHRNLGNQPVMIGYGETLNEVVDLTFETDAIATMVSASLNTTIYAVSASIGNNITAVSSSIDTRITAVSSSIDTRITAVSSSLSGRLTITGSCVNDAAAAAVGVAIGGLYHTTGTVKVRLT
jgi:hypothetical protein